MKKLLLTLIQFYQATAFIRRFFLPSLCRFYPSCSIYMAQAINLHGSFSGVLLGLRRLSCCHPLHPGGIDQLPGIHPTNFNSINQEISL